VFAKTRHFRHLRSCPALFGFLISGIWLLVRFYKTRSTLLESYFDKQPLEYLKYQLSKAETSVGAPWQLIL
jgi:hypothetical protein